MLQTYQSFPHSNVISTEYYFLCNRASEGTSEYEVPYIGELMQETWQSVDRDTIERSIQEATFRKDYEIFGMERDDFLNKAYRNEVPGFEPEMVLMMDIEKAVFRYLRAHYICFTDYDGSIVNSPIGSGVW